MIIKVRTGPEIVESWLIQSGPKWSKMVQNGPEWSKMVQGGPKISFFCWYSSARYNLDFLEISWKFWSWTSLAHGSMSMITSRCLLLNSDLRAEPTIYSRKPTGLPIQFRPVYACYGSVYPCRDHNLGKLGKNSTEKQKRNFGLPLWRHVSLI